MHIFINSLWIFSIFSFLGWLFQFIPRTIHKRKLTNPGFINLPFSVSCGVGSVLIYLVFSKWSNYFMIFFASIIMLTVLKFMYSMLFEKAFGFKWTDYSKKTLNLNGYVGLYEALSYGVIAVLMVKFAFNPISTLAAAIPTWLAILIPAIITGLIIADFINTIITIILLRRNLKQMNNISELLQESTSHESDEELRAVYEKRMVKNKVFRQRLVKAFPEMQSLNYEKQLEEIKDYFNVIRERNNEEYEKTFDNPEDRPFAFGLSFTKLFWLFFVGCIAGTVLETIWAFFTLGHFEIRVGLVWGPFIPVYGGGAVLITLCLYKLHKANDIIIYLASAVIGATFEYFCSYFQEKFLGTVSWDYSDTPFNIDGRTNLTFALIWGLLGLFWLRYAYPVFSRWIEKMPKKLGSTLTVIFSVFLIIDSVCSIAAVYRQTQRQEGIPPKTVIGETIDYCFNDDYMNFVFPHMCKPENWGRR